MGSIDLIGDRLGEDVTIEQMLSHVDLSPAYFAPQFKTTGLTPHEYVVRERIERVKQLLRNRKTPLSDIVFDCGFTHQSHMGRLFKKHLGITPKKYREEFDL